MDAINGLTRLASILRSQTTARSDRTQTRSTDRQGSSASKTVISTDLERGIFERVRLLDPSDIEWELHARQIVLASILTWEFGESMLNDPAFSAMIEDIERRLAANPASAKELAEIVAAFKS